MAVFFLPRCLAKKARSCSAASAGLPNRTSRAGSGKTYQWHPRGAGWSGQRCAGYRSHHPKIPYEPAFSGREQKYPQYRRAQRTGRGHPPGPGGCSRHQTKRPAGHPAAEYPPHGGCGCWRRNPLWGGELGQGFRGHSHGAQPPAYQLAQHSQAAVLVFAGGALNGAQHIVPRREHGGGNAQRVQVSSKAGASASPGVTMHSGLSNWRHSAAYTCARPDAGSPNRAHAPLPESAWLSFGIRLWW